jgi:hypothetical protein
VGEVHDLHHAEHDQQAGGDREQDRRRGDDIQR